MQFSDFLLTLDAVLCCLVFLSWVSYSSFQTGWLSDSGLWQPADCRGQVGKGPGRQELVLPIICSLCKFALPSIQQQALSFAQPAVFIMAHAGDWPAALADVCFLLRIWKLRGKALPPAAISIVIEALRPPELLLQLCSGVLVVSAETGRALKFLDTSRFGNGHAIADPASIHDFSLRGEVHSQRNKAGFELWVGSNQMPGYAG